MASQSVNHTKGRPSVNGKFQLRRQSSSERSAQEPPNGPHTPEQDSHQNALNPGNFNLPVRTANGLTRDLRPKVGRKNSSPMMPAFMTSAPGKVIVYGEHAVVYGKAAMAAAVSLRSYLLVTALSKSQRTISLRFPDISFSHTWRIDDLPWSLFSHPSKKKYYYDLVTSLDPELVHSLQPHLTVISPKVSGEQRKIHYSAAMSFLYLFLSLGSQHFPGCVYTLRSTLPIGAGLGSSASISVCLSSALLLQMRTLAGPHPDQPREEVELQIERINRWAFVGELCIHQNPSGVDNTVATYGKAVHFKRHDYSKPPAATPLYNFPELPLLLVNTKQSRSTATEVGKVSALKKAHPEITEHILDAIDGVTESAYRLISAPGFDAESQASAQVLGDLMNVNHGLLAALGVSHPRLERIRELVDSAGLGWTKLTGAGGGGSAITLLRPDIKSGSLRALESQLDAEDYERFEATVGGDGVGVLWPAVLRNGTDEIGGDEIDQEKFLNADGKEGVEQLVGVGVQEKREGWKFWRVSG